MCVCLVLVAVVCALLVRFHRRKTEGWENDHGNDYYPIFTCSFAVCLLSVFLALVFLSTAVVLGVFTTLLTFFFLADREIDYA